MKSHLYTINLMFKTTSCLLVLIFCVSTKSSYSQNYKMVKPYKYMLGLHWNIIDDDGTRAGGLFDVDSTWNFKSFPTSFSFDYYFRLGMSAEAIASYNHYDRHKIINGDTNQVGHVFTLDLNGRYSFGYLMEQQVFDPFALVGFGYTGREALWPQNMFSMNMGWGFNILFFRGLGIQYKSTIKMGVLPKFNDIEFDYLQHHFGIVFQIPEESSRNNFLKSKHSWVHKKPRWKRSGGR